MGSKRTYAWEEQLQHQALFFSGNSSSSWSSSLSIGSLSVTWSSSTAGTPFTRVLISATGNDNSNFYYNPPITGMSRLASAYSIYIINKETRPPSSFPPASSVTTSSQGCNSQVTFMLPTKSGVLNFAYTYSARIYFNSVCGMKLGKSFGTLRLNGTSPSTQYSVSLYNTASGVDAPGLFTGGYFTPDDGSLEELVFTIKPFVTQLCPTTIPSLQDTIVPSPFCTAAACPPYPDCPDSPAQSKAGTVAAIVLGISTGVLAVAVLVLIHRSTKKVDQYREPLVQ